MYHPRLKGTHYDMGFHYGDLLHKSGLSFENVIQLSDKQIAFGKESLKICKEVYPEVCEELRGLADGLVFSYETFASWLLCLYCFGDEHGCTCYCFKSGGKTIFARDSDMFPALKETSESILYRPVKGNIFLANSTALVEMEDGMNEHGLAAGLNFLLPNKIKPGLNAGFLVRYILERCCNVEEAISALKQLPISSTHNIVLADKSGEMAVVECSCEKVVVRKPNKDECFIGSANHFVTEEMQQYNGNPMENWYHSNERYDTVCNALRKPIPADSLSYAKSLSSGKLGFICQYEKELNFETLWASIYDLTELSIHIAEGNPAKKKFKEDTRLKWGIAKGK